MGRSIPPTPEGLTMLGCPPRRRSPVVLLLALLAALAMALPASAAAATAGPSSAHPYRIGHFHAVGSHWNLKVEHRNIDGNRLVRRADPFNAPPRLGYRYVLVRVSGKLLSRGVGGLAYDESFRLMIGRHSYLPAHVMLYRGLPQSGVVSHGMVVTAKVPFLVARHDLKTRMILRATSLLDWNSAPKYFRTTH